MNCKSSNPDLDASDIIFYKGKCIHIDNIVLVSFFFRICDNATVLTLLFNYLNFVNKLSAPLTDVVFVCCIDDNCSALVPNQGSTPGPNQLKNPISQLAFYRPPL